MSPSPEDTNCRINGGETVPKYRGGSANELSLYDIFALLQSRRRRCILYFLSDGNGVATAFDSVRDGVIEYEKRCRNASSTPEAITISLEHVHLPRLDEAGVVDWDRETARIEYLGNPLVERWLTETRELDIGPGA
jgi:hypothetical protein